MHDLAFAGEFNGGADIGVVDHTQEVIIGHARLLLSGEVLVQVGKHVTLDTDVLHIKRHTRSGLRVDARGVVGEIGIKARRADLVLGEVAGELIDHRGDHLKMRQLASAPMMETNAPLQKSLVYQGILDTPPRSNPRGFILFHLKSKKLLFLGAKFFLGDNALIEKCFIFENFRP